MGPTLTTRRIALRLLTPADAEALWPVVSDERVPPLMSWEAHRSPEETAEFLERTRKVHGEGSSLRWAILLDGALQGVVALEAITRTLRAWRLDRAELAYFLAPAQWGRGIATEAAAEVLRYAFEELGLHKVTVESLSENAASRRVIEKLGFRFVGERRAEVYRFDRWWDALAFELLREEWSMLRAR